MEQKTSKSRHSQPQVPEDRETEDTRASPLPVVPSSGKLFSSHSSIFNALINPDLDLKISSPPFATRDVFTPPPPKPFPVSAPVALEESAFSYSSWQSVNLPSEMHDSLQSWRNVSPCSASPKPTSTSILSSTSEGNSSDAANRPTSESMALVSSEKEIMVFETDEEDSDDDEITTHVPSAHQFNDDDKTLTNRSAPRKRVSVPSNSQTSFIMPKLSLSDNKYSYKISIVSSANASLRSDTAQLVAYIQQETDYTALQKMHISHLVLASPPFSFDVAAVCSSDLLFLVNDGSCVFPQFLSSLAEAASSGIPKTTVINIMTANYFVNLFEIISFVTPHQVWKVSSLRSASALAKVKSYIDSEMSQHSGSSYTREYEERRREFASKYDNDQKCDGHEPKFRSKRQTSQSMYDGLVPMRKSNYKHLRKQLRAELSVSSSYHDVDPLKLNSSLGHMRLLVNSVTELFSLSPTVPEPGPYQGSYSWKTGCLYVICSFSIGIGLGAIITNKTATGKISRLFLTQAPQQFVAVEQPEASPFSNTLEGMKRGLEHISSSTNAYFDSVMKYGRRMATQNVLPESFADSLVSDLKHFACSLVSSAWNGLSKATGLILGYW
ncbi:hypothetical protein FOB63_004532 [Clavispora lusitaniae]|uniref:uncharacterized protein n=1 Tax=Clavispora lusitaniae TaxID=36911 RepID=UPI00202C4905|nr:hypothetical protein FOB63_004532 [Clavispora lusitaniae]